MSLLDERGLSREDIAKGRYVEKVLREEGESIRQAQEKNMFNFSPDTFGGRQYGVNKNTLTYTHKKVHRFIDMRTRMTEKGKKKKKSHVIHNRPIYGVLNNIIHRISFGFTEEVRNEMMKLDGEKL